MIGNYIRNIFSRFVTQYLIFFPVPATSSQEDGLPSYEDIVTEPQKYPLNTPSAIFLVKSDTGVQLNREESSDDVPKDTPQTYQQDLLM